jgi:hypothetical protein
MLYLCMLTLVVTLLIAWPIIKHPTLPTSYRRWLATLIALLIILAGTALYLLLGIPQLAVL